MDQNVIPTLISGAAVIIGSLAGAIFSGTLSKKTALKTINEQIRLKEEELRYKENYKIKELCINANVIRLDICTVIYQSIRAVQNREKISYLYIIPISKDYQSAVASLADKYTLKELSYIYQLYGILEKVNKEVYKWEYGDKEGYKKILMGYRDIVIKLYGENINNILEVDIDKVGYEDLYDNDLIKPGYREVLSKLDKLCYMENISKEASRILVKNQ